MSKYGLTRRGFLGAVAAGTLTAACTADQPGADNGARGGATKAPARPGEYRESPLLAKRVSAGSLPPVKQRLPKEPFVVRPGVLIDDEPVKMQPGKFGGALQLPRDPNFDSAVFLGSVEPLLWAPGGVNFRGDVMGNVLAGWEANADDTVFTLHLREGLRWSDGKPVTIDDVRFAFDDVLLNQEITAVFPADLRGVYPNSPPPKLTVIDDLTFSFTFDRPYGTFPARIGLGEWRGYGDLIKPRHYLEQFHKKYASQKTLADLLKKESIPADQWFNLFNAKQFTGQPSNEQLIGHPMLTPWILKRASGDVLMFERNPYYFKVDADGNQLPYVDELRSQEVQDPETLISRALFGEFDYTVEWMSLKTLPKAMDKQNAGEASVLVSRLHRTNVTFYFNLTHPDQNWRTVVRDVRFRRALSLAINRKEILEEFYLGQFAELPKETNSAEYDQAAANQLLDDMGLTQKDGEGFRLGPDGKRFTVPIEFFAVSEDHSPMSELVAEYWKKVGVHTTSRLIDSSLWSDRTNANELKASALFIPHDFWNLSFFNQEYRPVYWGVLWHQWYNSGGKTGEEPPDEIKQLSKEHETFMSSRIGSPESDAAYAAIMKSHLDNVWTFNPVEHVYYPCFWSSRVKNVPVGIKKEVFGIIGNISMEQWYIEE